MSANPTPIDPSDHPADAGDLAQRVERLESLLPQLQEESSVLKKECSQLAMALGAADYQVLNLSKASQELEDLGLHDETGGLLQLLAARSGEPKSSVLRKALTLYGIALDSIEIGNRLAILNDEDEIVRDILGFDATSSAPIHSS